MAIPTLALVSGVDLTTAVLFAFVGYRLSQRPVEGPARVARDAFSVWWFALSGTAAIQGARGLAAAFGVTETGPGLAAVLALHYLWVVLLVAAVWGLLYYLLYLFTGRTGVFWPLTIFYGGYAALALWLVHEMRPSGVVAGAWFSQVAYANPAGQGLLLGLLALIVLPQLGGAIAYFSLFFKLTDRTLRYRVLLVSMSLIVWFGSGVLAPLLRLGQYEWWQAGGRLIGLTAALVILLAYYPPKWVIRRYDVGSLSREPAR